MNVHTRTVNTRYWFGHKCSMNSMHLCHSLKCGFHCHHPVCSPESMSILEINLVLSGSYFMVARFHVYPHQHQSLHHIFFQAEDGIRDWSVTGVQTCALPI